MGRDRADRAADTQSSPVLLNQRDPAPLSLVAIYAQALPWLLPDGDGSIGLSHVGFQATYRQPTAAANQGRFSCSDPAITEIWSLGEYALDAASLPAGALPALWDVGPDGATVYGDTYTGYQRGLGWTDYTARFEVRIVANEASWLVRAQPPDGVRCVLCAAEDRLAQSEPNSLRIYRQFNQRLIATIVLSAPLREREWHAIDTIIHGSTREVAIDGKSVATVSIPVEGGFWGSTAAGWVALANASGAIAQFRNLQVVGADGDPLLRTSLTDPAILGEFVAGSNRSSAIVDGAARDRLLFTGDLGVAAQTLAYTSFDLPYLADSIDLFSRYQRTDGAIPTAIPPQANPPRTPGNAFAADISDYTVHHLTTLYTHWLHTGDWRFLHAQWPVVGRVLEYLNGHTDRATGLFMEPEMSGPVRPARVGYGYVGPLGPGAHRIRVDTW